MKNKEVFKELIVLDIANNHYGSVIHAKKIIDEFSKIIKRHKINATFKFQFRDLETFIHKDFKNSDEKYVKRFLSTKLSPKEFSKINNFIKKKKIKSACTPFDEKSIDAIENLKFNYLKIASVSALDFSLHERAIKNKIPKIISTGGLKLSDIDKIVSFYIKKNQTFALMHCIAIYPSKNSDLQISFIKNLKKRYNDVPIGWSTHEDPREMNPATLAYACGAQIFEKHIGVNSKKFGLNNYSITPTNFEKWHLNLLSCKEILGSQEKVIDRQEIKTLNTLQRGVYAKVNLKKGQILNKKNTYFAFPLQNNQLPSTQFKDKSFLKTDIFKDKPIKNKSIQFDKQKDREDLIYSYLHKLKAMLNYNSITIGQKLDLEISHHKGIENFEKVGCFLFNIINEEYAKKLLVMLPNQSHPVHHHKLKKESFLIIAGTIHLNYNGKKFFLKSGDVFHIERNSWHKFKSGKDGCIFEEISTTSFKSDSYYKSIKIKSLGRDKRKTYINNWFTVKNFLVNG
jgi:sialic acid synthase SpsE/quercetin dioxygenase-like cupin family protein